MADFTNTRESGLETLIVHLLNKCQARRRCHSAYGIVL